LRVRKVPVGRRLGVEGRLARLHVGDLLGDSGVGGAAVLGHVAAGELYLLGDAEDAGHLEAEEEGGRGGHDPRHEDDGRADLRGEEGAAPAVEKACRGSGRG